MSATTIDVHIIDSIVVDILGVLPTGPRGPGGEGSGEGTVTTVNLVEPDGDGNVALAAGDIPATPGGGLGSSTVGAQLAELDTEKANVGAAPTAHAASHAAAGTDPVTLTQGQITGLVAALATKLTQAAADLLYDQLGAASTVNTALTAEATARVAADLLLIPLTQKAAANGVATLDGNGTIPTNQLPALAINETFTAVDQAAMLALTAQRGDVAIRTDLDPDGFFLLVSDSPGTLADWKQILAPGTVLSVDGRTGTVSLSDLYDAIGSAAAAEAFARERGNHTGTQFASTISDFATAAVAATAGTYAAAPSGTPGTGKAPVTTGSGSATAWTDVATQAELDAVATAKADDSAVVKLSGDQSVAGVKTFSSAPVVPAEAYASGWNGKQEPAPKDAVWDALGAVSAAGKSMLTAVDAAAQAVLLGAEVFKQAQAVNAQTGTTYTLVAGDAGKLVSLSNASSITLTLPQDSDATIAVGTYVDLYQLGAGQVTVAAGTGATLRTSGLTAKARAQYSRLGVQKVSANTWSLFGDLAAS